MFKNYLLVSLRNLSKRKFFSALNIGGLAIGMAACLLIFQYVVSEHSFDNFHENRDRLYRLNMTEVDEGESETAETTFSTVGPILVEALPEIEQFARFHSNAGEATLAFTDRSGQRQVLRETGLAYVDPAFLELFSFPMLDGDKKSVLSEPRSMIISESVARRYFGEESPVGQTISLRAWSRGDYTISGVFEDLPGNSHLQFDFLMPLEDLLIDSQYATSDGWTWRNFVTYMLLRPDAVVQDLNRKGSEVIQAHSKQRADETHRSFQVTFQPLERIHLYSDFEAEFDDWNKGSRQTVYLFTLVALFILAIAWVNYINLSTSRAIERSKEVGIRKAVGALQGQVIWQFVFESATVNLLAFALAMVLAALGLPYLNELAGTSIDLSFWLHPWFIVGCVVLFGLGSLLASLYPAFILSAYEPAVVLKTGSSRGLSRDHLRQALVVFQFAASVSLLISTYVVYAQVQHIRGFDLGLELEQIVVIKRPTIIVEGSTRRELREVFKSKLEVQASIGSVAMSNTVPGGDFPWGTTINRMDAPKSTAEEVYVTWVSYEFLETYGLNLIYGRNFAEEFESDREGSVLLNETAALALGFDSGRQAVNQRIDLGTTEGNVRTVIGVLEDFKWMSAKQEVTPVALSLTPAGMFYSLKIETSNLDESLAEVKSIYDGVFPGNSFDYFFADRFFDEQHRADRRFSTLFGIFALFALLVACLGLIGLAAYTANQRTKEIGVRKAFGARSVEIIGLLVADTAKLVVTAIVLATPLMYLALDQWLTRFPIRIDLTAWAFIIPSAVVLIVAFLTIAYHTTRVAVMNPVESLRYE
jgi:putative ABC transport system permease protein